MDTCCVVISPTWDDIHNQKINRYLEHTMKEKKFFVRQTPKSSWANSWTLTLFLTNVGDVLQKFFIESCPSILGVSRNVLLWTFNEKWRQSLISMIFKSCSHNQKFERSNWSQKKRLYWFKRFYPAYHRIFSLREYFYIIQ